MPPWTFFKDYRHHIGEVQVRGATPLNAAQYRVRLLDSITVTQEMTAIDLISSELLQEFGYSPQPYLLPTGDSGDSVWDAVAGLWRYPKQEPEFPAVGQSLQWTSAVLWGNSSSIGSKTITDVNASTNRLTVTTHGLTSADPVAVSAVEGARPSGIISSLYYAKPIDTNTIELYTDAGLTSVVDILDSGSGALRLRYAKGKPVSFVNFPTQTIGDGTSQTVDIYWTT